MFEIGLGWILGFPTGKLRSVTSSRNGGTVVEAESDEAATCRDCHGFRNPCGLRVGVGRGTGTGWHFEPPTKPAPVARVDGFVEGSLSAF